MTTVTGKSLFVPFDELGGNCVVVEGFFAAQKYQIGLYHLEDVFVDIGDIILDETVLGTQGNTGIVHENKPLTARSYGTHVHIEVIDSSSTFVDPRDFATGEKHLFLDHDLSSISNDEKVPEGTSNYLITSSQAQKKPLFVCAKEGTYFVKMKKGEQLFIVSS